MLQYSCSSIVVQGQLQLQQRPDSVEGVVPVGRHTFLYN